ncbi:TIGR02530 family flagellar biosynthesis protein [Effusibacillus lacus]|uniref:Flagellar biosynthesis protein n=1 Tax=Effusibacillus lacus TaxID=1348429 RepID=A0A292YNP2_9BACL|nr:TIGR02530 family flagellar biosynthesis protein [Effusibacillus lacus]TCS73124.1 flagellar operon protein [Effusibacillus lacus]GAX90529.1 flagellar biosynthesis protein [Effusibacillus lacus]
MNQEWLLGVRGPLPVTKAEPTTSKRRPEVPAGLFQAELAKRLRQQEVVLSNHAKQRLEKRDIRLNETDLQKIGQAINQVAAKGGKESLIMYKDTAFVINVPNRTIITAVDKLSLKENVFTNIDSAMIL